MINSSLIPGTISSPSSVCRNPPRATYYNSNSPARSDLDALVRRPSDLKRYIAWTTAIKAEYGSITNFVCRERLGWHHIISTPTPSPSTGSVPATNPNFAYKDPTPFADPEDYRILRNDWPYGLEDGITHLVVWLRTPIAVTEGGYMTEESRTLVEGFVESTFVGRLREEGFRDPETHVMWFKNWTALQSVRALEHVHVLVRNVPEKLLYEWTGEPPVLN